MDTELLKTFLVVSKHQSLTLAAKELSVTQPALTKRIKRLESLVATELFDRVGNQLLLTEAGRLLFDKSPAVLNLIDETLQAVQDLSGKVAGRLSIATSHYIGMQKLPKVLERFTQSHPQVDLNIEFIDSGKAYEKVLSGDLDLALLTFPEEQDDRLTHTVIWQESLHIVCHQQHPLAQGSLDIDHFAHYPCLLPPSQTFPRQLFEHQLAHLGIRLGKVKTANYLEVIEQLISCGMGWGILPKTLISDNLVVLDNQINATAGLDIEQKNSTIAAHSPQHQRHMGIIYRTNKSLSNAAIAFIEHLFPESSSRFS